MKAPRPTGMITEVSKFSNRAIYQGGYLNGSFWIFISYEQFTSEAVVSSCFE